MHVFREKLPTMRTRPPPPMPLLRLGLASAAVLLGVARPVLAAQCVDAERDCRYWAHSGECRHNWDWMSTRCPLSCGVCLGDCSDVDAACSDWAAAGECESNERYMLERCPASCDLCPTLTGGALECDACVALQEALWRNLAHRAEHATGGGGGGGGGGSGKAGTISPVTMRRAVSDICIAHEWLSLEASGAYASWCELTISLRSAEIEASWRALLDASPAALLDRSSALKQKLAMCTVSGGPQALATCDERRSARLRLAAPVGDGLCSACRAYVRDAVSLLRRGGVSFPDTETADYRRATHALGGVCDDLDMRHNGTAGVPSSRVYENCNELVSTHLDALAKLVSAWHHHSVEHEMCARTLRLCSDADADGAAGPKQEL